MTVADDLRAGANYIREHGHAKRTAEAGDGSVCAMGGIARGMGADVRICYSIATWSDHTFKDDVITGMEKAAAWSEEQA